MTIVADKIAKMLGRDVKSDTVHYTTNKLKKGAIDPVSIYGKMRDDSTTISVDKKKKGGITHSLEHFIKDDEPGQEGSGRVISYETYKQYAKKYKIRLTKNINGERVRKTIKQLQKEIYDHETNSPKIKKGLYYN